MVFSSLTFLCVFLPLVLLIYNFSRSVTYKNAVITFSSLLFYAWGEPSFILLLLAASFINYVLAIVMDRYYGLRRAKAILVFTVLLDIAMIGVFKYAAFLTESANAVFSAELPVPQIGLPLGISFYTFQILSYVVDVYRNETHVQKSYLKFLTYVSMFPQLIAGPIVRYSEVEKSINKRKVRSVDFADGAKLFVLGLSKKVILANYSGSAKDLLLSSTTHATVGSSWLGIIFYTFQLYFDFSGYSDMAIGMGRMLGFSFPKNFNYPYVARSITDFWRRWHMTLSGFFRDYVYIPLGGNRRRQIMNIMIVWLLTGLWHGASWNFVLWGVYYGVLLIIEKHFFKWWSKIPVLSNLTTMFFVIVGWGIFNFTDFSELRTFMGHLFGVDCGLYDITTVSVLCSNAWLLLACVLVSTPLPMLIYDYITSIKFIGFIIEGAVMVLMFAACVILLTGATSNPFLYFRF